MRIKGVHLRNIRSYVDEQIAFPEGSVLLSGDIGSGKTTILLAIEFALFGLLRGSVAGSTLLRHSARHGSVSLTISLHNKELTITRVLKREKDAVNQEAGSIVMDGVTHDLTAVELKNKVLGLIGYPQSLLTKSKNLIYRYTVFCPQEDMKRILEEDEDARLETLRRLFNVDKYKRIQDNAKIVLQELRVKKSGLEAQSSGIQELENELKELQEQMVILSNELKSSTEAVENSSAKLKQAVGQAQKAAEAIKRFQALKQESAVVSAKKKAKLELLAQKDMQVQRARQEIAKLGSITVPNIEELKAKKKLLENNLIEIEQTLRKSLSRNAELLAVQKTLLDTKQKVSVLEHCPLCLQQVTHNHKKQIQDDADNKLSELNKELNDANERIKNEESSLSQQKKILEQARDTEAQSLSLQLRKQQLEREQSLVLETEKELASIHQEIKTLAEHESLLASQLVGSASLEQELLTAEKTRDDLQKKHQQLAVVDARLKEKDLHLQARIKQANKLVEERKASRKRLDELTNLQHYLDEHFLGLMATMEKHVLATVYHEFNSCFQEVFALLVDGLTAQLDDAFAPVVSQDGYVTAFSSLSGGERTACALAYRLALNRAVNSVVSTIHTRDLLILDEPTDGFSDEQVDKLRDVLDKLNTSQLIIVSHEQKMESFVENVIHVNKQAGESKVG